MDKVQRRYNKVNKEDKCQKKIKKTKSKIAKTQFEKLVVDLKQRKHNYQPPADQLPGKITAGRITVSFFLHSTQLDHFFGVNSHFIHNLRMFITFNKYCE